MRSLLAAALLSLLLAACTTTAVGPEQSPAPVGDGTPSKLDTSPVVPDGLDPTAITALNDPKSAVFKRDVYFDYDQYVIRDEFKSLIQAHAQLLTRNSALKVLVQGHADERGSREYNLALGQKRAEAVKKALLLMGAKEDQVEAASLGKEKPACEDHTEECWAMNRRGHLFYPQADK